MGALEYADFERNGIRTNPGGIEGKHFWGTREHAIEYVGRAAAAYGDDPPFYVVKVTFKSPAKVASYEQHCDGVGPAYFADAEELQYIVRTTVVARIPEEDQ